MQSEENPFNVQIEYLDGLTPSETILRADERSLLERAQTALEQAQAQAQTVLHEARAEAARIRAAAAQLGEAEKEIMIRQMHDENVQHGLQWFVEEARLEAALVNRVETRVRDLLVTVLREWIDDQDRLMQLAHWLVTQVRNRAQSLPCRVRVHPDEHDVLVAHLMQNGLPEAVDCSADASLAKGQAIVDTEFLRIEFNLARHWEQVLAALKQSTSMSQSD